MVEGPRALEGALDRGASLEAVYLGPGADVAFPALVDPRPRAPACRCTRSRRVCSRRSGPPAPRNRCSRWRPIVRAAARRARPRRPRGGRHVDLRPRQPRHDPALRGGRGRGGNRPRARIGRRLQSQGRSRLGGRDLRDTRVGSRCGRMVPGGGARRPRCARSAAAGCRRHRRRCPTTPRISPGPPRWCSATRPTVSTPRCTARLDGTVAIPMAGATESLNVAMAATVLCFEAARQRRAQGSAR